MTRPPGAGAPLLPEIAAAVARAAGAVREGKGTPEAAQAALRAAGVAMLPALPASALRHAVAALAPMPDAGIAPEGPALVAADPARLAARLALQGEGPNGAPSRAAWRLARRLAGTGLTRLEDVAVAKRDGGHQTG